MNLKQITLINYKNHEELSVAADAVLTGITGPNGIGKTNLLEGIYYGLTGLPYFHRSDKYNIRKGETTGAIRLQLEDDGESTEVRITLNTDRKKTIHVNGVPLERITDYIGTYPAVMIAPGDIELINGASDERRRFLDRGISLCNRHYLQTVTKYNRLLDQRNKQLKMFYEQRYFDDDLLHVMDMQIAPLGDEIFEVRKKFLKQFIPRFKAHYAELEGGGETVDILYESHLGTKGITTSDLLKDHREADRYQQRTTMGVHKDELAFLLEANPLKKYGSQGQIKTFLIALNLAAFDMILRLSGKTPFLLLDDIFEKIDARRAGKLMEVIHQPKFGQIFVTDTEKDRLEKATSSFEKSRQFIALESKVLE